MKRIIALLLVLSLLLTACAQQKAVETAPVEVPAEEPVVETPAVETPAAPAEEPEAVEEAAETPATPAETPKAETDEQFFDVKKGDSITYKTTTFVVEDLTNQGNYMTLYFDPIRFHLYALNKPEILSGIEYTIVENNFNRQNSVKLRVRSLVLGKDEYLLEKGNAATVGGKQFILGDVMLDTRATESVYFTMDLHQYWVSLGNTIDADGFSITLKSAFYKQRQYAILKIVPK